MMFVMGKLKEYPKADMIWGKDMKLSLILGHPIVFQTWLLTVVMGQPLHVYLEDMQVNGILWYRHFLLETDKFTSTINNKIHGLGESLLHRF